MKKHKSIMQAGREAGLSKHQIIQALRVASIPADEFEAMVESDRTPTVTELAEQGLAHRMERAPAKRKRYKVEIADDLKDVLDVEAQTRDISVTGLLNEIIRDWLARRA